MVLKYKKKKKKFKNPLFCEGMERLQRLGLDLKKVQHSSPETLADVSISFFYLLMFLNGMLMVG